MNRRAFLSGLLSTTAAIPMDRLWSGAHWRADLDASYELARQRMTEILYGDSFVPQPAWARDVYPVIKAAMDRIEHDEAR
jgi:hypothetical protein